MLSSISVPESSLLETVRLHSTSLVHSPVSCKPRCPLRSLPVRNVGRARAWAGAEDKWATTAQCARSYARARQQDNRAVFAERRRLLSHASPLVYRKTRNAVGGAMRRKQSKRESSIQFQYRIRDCSTVRDFHQ